MRVHQLICTECKATISSKAGVEEGTVVACPKCKGKFKVVAPKKQDDEEVVEEFEVVEEDEAETPKKKPAARNERPAKKVVDEDDEDDEEPRPKRKSQRDRDDSPRSKRSSRDEDEDDDDDYDVDRPRKKRRGGKSDSAYGKMKGNIWIRISVMTVLLGTLGVLSYFLYQRIEEDRKTEAENEVERIKQENLGKPIRRDGNMKWN